jgi:hypothetical protein
VQERGRDRLVVEPQVGADLGRAEWMVDERLAGAALLALVCACRELEGVRDQVAVGVRVVAGDLGNQLFEEICVPFLSLEKRHGRIVVRLPFVTVLPGSQAQDSSPSHRRHATRVQTTLQTTPHACRHAAPDRAHRLAPLS